MCGDGDGDKWRRTRRRIGLRPSSSEDRSAAQRCDAIEVKAQATRGPAEINGSGPQGFGGASADLLIGPWGGGRRFGDSAPRKGDSVKNGTGVLAAQREGVRESSTSCISGRPWQSVMRLRGWGRLCFESVVSRTMSNVLLKWPSRVQCPKRWTGNESHRNAR